MEFKKVVVKQKKLIAIVDAKLKEKENTVKVLKALVNKRVEEPKEKEDVVVIEQEVFKCNQCPETFTKQFALGCHLNLIHI